MDLTPPETLLKPLVTVDKVLLGAGPSNASQRVLKAMNRQLMGHLHPETYSIMDEIKEGCQYILQTRNPVTLCLSTSGHGGMEAALCNLLEDNDVILVGITGIWGERASDMSKRYNADVRLLTVTEFGSALTLKEIANGLKEHAPKVLFLAHGDSSTGVLQPMDGIGDLCRQYNCLLVVDAVASLCGTPFSMDKWKIDVVYSGSQKVLSAPPGITPISFNNRAMEKVLSRKTLIKVFYWDINLIGGYWNCFGRPRLQHHTVSSTLLYGLREALAIICEEGINSCIERHAKSSKRLQDGIEKLGLSMFVKDPEQRLPTINSIVCPTDVDWAKVITYAMKNYTVEIAGGLGPTAGKVFRVGLMGENSTDKKVDYVLSILKEAFAKTKTQETVK